MEVKRESWSKRSNSSSFVVSILVLMEVKRERLEVSKGEALAVFQSLF